MLKTMLAAIGVMLFCGTAIADNYVGIGAGPVRVKDSAGGISLNAEDEGAKLFGGWRLHDNFALELAYINGGSPEDQVGYGVKIEADLRAMQVSGIGTLPLTDKLGVYVRAGLLSWKSEIFATDGFSSATVDTDGEDFSWGLGTSLGIGSRTAIRLEYEGADLDGTDVSFISLSGIVRFGAN